MSKRRRRPDDLPDVPLPLTLLAIGTFLTLSALCGWTLHQSQGARLADLLSLLIASFVLLCGLGLAVVTAVTFVRDAGWKLSRIHRILIILTIVLAFGGITILSMWVRSAMQHEVLESVTELAPN